MRETARPPNANPLFVGWGRNIVNQGCVFRATKHPESLLKRRFRGNRSRLSLDQNLAQQGVQKHTARLSFTGVPPPVTN